MKPINKSEGYYNTIYKNIFVMLIEWEDETLRSKLSGISEATIHNANYIIKASFEY